MLKLIIAFLKLTLINTYRKKPTLPQIVLVNYFISLVKCKNIFHHELKSTVQKHLNNYFVGLDNIEIFLQNCFEKTWKFSEVSMKQQLAFSQVI
jgi:hypothetical protein